MNMMRTTPHFFFTKIPFFFSRGFFFLSPTNCATLRRFRNFFPQELMMPREIKNSDSAKIETATTKISSIFIVLYIVLSIQLLGFVQLQPRKGKPATTIRVVVVNCSATITHMRQRRI